MTSNQVGYMLKHSKIYQNVTSGNDGTYGDSNPDGTSWETVIDPSFWCTLPNGLAVRFFYIGWKPTVTLKQVCIVLGIDEKKLIEFLTDIHVYSWSWDIYYLAQDPEYMRYEHLTLDEHVRFRKDTGIDYDLGTERITFFGKEIIKLIYNVFNLNETMYKGLLDCFDKANIYGDKEKFANVRELTIPNIPKE